MAPIAALLFVRSFRSDFWKLWIGQTISTFGGSFTSFALPLLIFLLTGSSLNLALSVGVSVLPYLLFGLPIGAWVDHADRKRLMMFSDLLRALIIASIPFAALCGWLSVWWIYIVMFLHSTLTIGFDAAQFAALPSLVSQDKLTAANGWLRAGYSLANVLGPALAGLLLFLFPVALLLLVDAVSFLVSALSLFLIRTSFSGVAKSEDRLGLRRAIAEGLHYVLRHPLLSWLTLLLFLINFILPTSSVQLVLLAKEQFAASDAQVGLLYAAGSLGTILFSLSAGLFRKLFSSRILLLGGLALEGIFTALPSLTHWYWLLFLCWCLRGGTDVLFMIYSYSLIQTVVSDRLLGRVMTCIRMLTWPTASLGALLGGLAIQWTGRVGLVYAVVGALVAVIALAFFMTPLRRSS